MKKLCGIFCTAIMMILFANPCTAGDFLKVKGPDIVNSNGEKFYIKGTNLGNWVNPEGYMFAFQRTNSAGMINDLLSQLVGPAKAKKFWKDFKENYITEKDVKFIASKGANTIRLPFHYKLFTNEDYMGLNDPNEGFRIVDSVVNWCRNNNLRLILDMHDCPGGQTGDNIDDSFGYPFLMIDADSQAEFVDLWGKIAARYADEPVILGYELMNEPIATYWEGEEKKMLNDALQPLYKRAVAEIRKHDKNHIILLGGAQWNSNFEPLTEWDYDDNIMFTCHRYGGEPTAEYIYNFIEYRDRTGLPMYMGELGHNTDKWMSDFVKTMRANNIGYTFWPYKKIADSSMTGVNPPVEWEKICTFSELPRGTYSEIRAARDSVGITPAQAEKILWEYIENSKADNMLIHQNYIDAIGINE